MFSTTNSSNNNNNTSSFSLSGFGPNTPSGNNSNNNNSGGFNSAGSSLFGSTNNNNAGSGGLSSSHTSNSLFGQSIMNNNIPQQQQSPIPQQNGGGMTHSQSTYDLNRSLVQTPTLSPAPSPYGSRHIATTPSWGKHDRRKIPSHISTMRTQSSFTPDRNTLGSSGSRHGSISASQSPPNTFTGSFGTAKPIQTKKSNVIDEEDLPPTESIYDTGASPFTRASEVSTTGSRGSNSSGGNTTGGTIPSSNSTLGLRRLSNYNSNANTNNPSIDAKSPMLASSNNTTTTTTATTNSTNYDSNNNNCSIIVFGFPPSLTPTVIKHFSKFGNILENYDMTKGGEKSPSGKRNARAPPIQTGPNWAKITYDNPYSAAKAISHNNNGGSTFIGGCAIGCVPFNSVNAKEFGYASNNNTNGLDQQENIAEEGDDVMMDIDSPQTAGEKKHIQTDKNNRPLPRTISMPVMGKNDTTTPQQSSTPNSRRLQVKDGKSIFNNKQRTVKFAPSMGNMQSKDNIDSTTGSKLKPARQGWLSWTTKRAQELVFGWDDL